MSRLISAAAAAFAVVAASSAHAEMPRIVMVSQTISYDTAKLATPESATALLRRIERAAQRACSPRMNSPAEPQVSAAIIRCRAQAVANAVENLGAPMVTAAHRNRQAVAVAAQ